MPVKHRNLPRLGRESYRGTGTAVHWIFTVHDRATGWLTREFHAHFREIATHTGSRHGCVVAVYCLMPDHIHVLLWAAEPESDLSVAARFLRTHTAGALLPFRYQRQAYDHVLNEDEMECRAFEAIAWYIAENPVRARLVARASDYPFTGSLIPGYPNLRLHEEGYWNLFWRLLEKISSP